MKKRTYPGIRTGLVLFSALIAAGLAAAGCSRSTGTAAAGQDQGSFNTLGTYPLVKDKETITIMISASTLEDKTVENWLTQFYEEKTNVHVNWNTAPLEQFRERINLALASSEEVDLVTGVTNFTLVDVQRLARERLVHPLQGYIESDTVNLKKNLDSIQGWRQSYTLPDGNIYSVPRLNECLHCAYYGKMWINKEFMKNLNMAMPATIPEFHDMLLAFKNRDANGNGDPNDEVPFMGATDNYGCKIDTYIISAYVYDDGVDRLYVDNGRITAAYQQPEFQEGLRTLRQWYSEGLIHQDSFTATRAVRAQLNSQKYESVIGAIPNIHHGNLGNRAEGEPVRWIDYEPIPPLTGPRGLRAARYDYYTQFETAQFVNFLPSVSRKPALVMRWLDWFQTEEGVTTMVFGGKGIGWADADPGATGLDGRPAVYNNIGQYLKPGDPWYENRSWGQGFPNMRTAAYRAGEQGPADALAPDGSGAEKFLHIKTLENYVPYAWPVEIQLPPIIYQEAVVSELALLKTNINTYVDESIAKFTTGALDVNRDWAAFQTNLQNLGLDRYLQIIQTNYDASPFVKK